MESGRERRRAETQTGTRGRRAAGRGEVRSRSSSEQGGARHAGEDSVTSAGSKRSVSRPRVLWGRIAILVVVLVGAFFLGRATAQAAGSASAAPERQPAPIHHMHAPAGPAGLRAGPSGEARSH